MYGSVICRYERGLKGEVILRFWTHLAIITSLLILVSSIAAAAALSSGEHSLCSLRDITFRKAVIANAVVDRFEGDYAVIFWAEKEHKFDLPRKHLPSSVTEGAVLEIRIEMDSQKTHCRTQRLQKRLDKLR